MTDPNARPVQPHPDPARARAEARATRERALAATLAELGVTPTEASLFHVVQYGLTLAPADLPGRAASDSYSLAGPATEEGCRSALAACLGKGWLQVIDDSGLAEITADLRGGRLLGPVYGLPPAGGVDFTRAGAELWLALSRRCFRGARETPYAYTDVVREQTSRHYRTRTAAVAAVARVREADDVVTVAGPFPTGPWRAQWWRRFPAGYRVDVEERRRWEGRGDGGGEECYLDPPARTADPGRLRAVLDRHNVMVVEWLLLASMEWGWGRTSAARLCREVGESGGRLLGAEATEGQCRDGLAACLRYGWLRVVDRRAADEVRTVLAGDSALLAVPRTAEGRPRECCYTVDPLRPDRLVPAPLPASHRGGEVDFTPVGAALYRMISAEWLGPHWEDDLHVARTYAWEEHRYCEAEAGFEGIVPEHVARGEIVRASRVEPIGPWCVYWWDRFPAGFRLELELAEP